jgi:hypothetical protein
MLQLCRTAELPAGGKGPLAANGIFGDQVSSTVPGAPWLGHPAQTAATVAGFLR